MDKSSLREIIRKSQHAVIDEASAIYEKNTIPITNILDDKLDKATPKTEEACGRSSEERIAYEQRRARAKLMVAAKLKDAMARNDFEGTLSVVQDKECMWYMGQEVMNAVLTKFVLPAREIDPSFRVDFVAGIESQGYIFGPWIARSLDCGFVPVRLYVPNEITVDSVNDDVVSIDRNFCSLASSGQANQSIAKPAAISAPQISAEVRPEMFRSSAISPKRRPTVLLVDDFTIQGWVLEASYKALVALDLALVGIFLVIRGRDPDMPPRSLQFEMLHTEILFDMAIAHHIE